MLSHNYSTLKRYCTTRTTEFEIISNSRKQQLEKLSDYLVYKYQAQTIPKIIVICTHNSRRSHLGQLWLAKAANYYELPALETFSGGTEATALNPRVITAIKKVGFGVGTKDTNNKNPTYFIRWSQQSPFYKAFSKKYDTPPNPLKDFAAILVCTEADKDCPFVEGADFRLSLPYEDPKLFDDTPQEEEKYMERCQQIAREMLYVMQKVKINLN